MAIYVFLHLYYNTSSDVDYDLTANIIVVSSVDTNVEGEYVIAYNVIDGAGDAALEVTRTVIVVPVAEETNVES